jgi:glycosyltransferase involved in cell wall biosynthesis
MKPNTIVGRKLKLMQITHDLSIGGLQQVIVNICRTINRDKFDISVLCLRDLGEFTMEVESMGIKVFYLPQKDKGTDYLSFLKVARILRNEKIDIIHTHNTQPFLDGTIGAFLSGVKTIVHTDHARDFPDKKRYMVAEWLMSRFAYKVVGVSDHTSLNLIKYEHISPEKIITIFNGIDELKYNIKIDKMKKRKTLGIKLNGPVIGLGVRLSHQKGITHLLQAMPSIIKKIPNLSLVIAGKGELLEELQMETNSLDIQDHVFWVGPRLDMPELLKLFDLYVLPSLWEGMPMVLIEAMASGCPIIATDVGGNSSVIKQGVNGSLIRAGNSAELAMEVVRVLSDKELIRKYISNSLNRFYSLFSARTMTEKYEKLYLKMSVNNSM